MRFLQNLNLCYTSGCFATLLQCHEGCKTSWLTCDNVQKSHASRECPGGKAQTKRRVASTSLIPGQSGAARRALLWWSLPEGVCYAFCLILNFGSEESHSVYPFASGFFSLQ